MWSYDQRCTGVTSGKTAELPSLEAAGRRFVFIKRARLFDLNSPFPIFQTRSSLVPVMVVFPALFVAITAPVMIPVTAAIFSNHASRSEEQTQRGQQNEDF
jgi:hypothetical protein